jgi:hypothetical protein
MAYRSSGSLTFLRLAATASRDRPLVPERVRWNLPQVCPVRDPSSAQSPPGGLPGGAMWRWLLGLQQPHVGGLGALRPLLDVELDGLPLSK